MTVRYARAASIVGVIVLALVWTVHVVSGQGSQAARSQAVAIAAGRPAASFAGLTAADYIEIRQLVARYAYAVDTGADNGNVYASLFAPDGAFADRMNVAATVQSTPGPVISANRLYTNAEIQPSLGRPLSGGAANTTINLLVPGDIYGDRVNQFDLRLSKVFRFGGRRAQANLDIYNVMNANPVMQENASYAVWRTPQRIMDARLFKISGQFDF